MSDDNREWTAVGEQAGAARAGETIWSGPYLKPGERVTVVPKSRAERAEAERDALKAQIERLPDRCSMMASDLGDQGEARSGLERVKTRMLADALSSGSTKEK